MLHRTFFSFLLTLLYFTYFCETTTILTTFNGYREYSGIITISQKSLSGKGLTCCSWLKHEQRRIPFFAAIDENTQFIDLEGEVDFEYHELFAENEPKGSRFLTIVPVENLINYTSWYHVCYIVNQTAISFYYNGCPEEKAKRRDVVSLNKTDNMKVLIGDVEAYGMNGSFFQTNVFERVITAKEAWNMYKCKHMKGDIVSWTDITSRSQELTFGDKIKLMEDTDPCSDQLMNSQIGNLAPGSSSRNMDPGSSSADSSQGSNSQGWNSGNIPQCGPNGTDPGSTVENNEPGSSSGSTPSGSSSGSTPSGSSSGNTPSGSSSGNTPSGSSSGSTPLGSSSGSTPPGSSSGNTPSGSSSGNTPPGSSSGNIPPGSSSGNTPSGSSSF